jgi:hypothetical protein
MHDDDGGGGDGDGVPRARPSADPIGVGKLEKGERIYDKAKLTWASGRTEVISFGSGVVVPNDKSMGVALVLQIFQVGPGRYCPPRP